ncbi:hypothetical protein [Lampropedia hyalina]|jgi:RNase P protein component|nr:hypothetical protein [Lampropedia hyalina]
MMGSVPLAKTARFVLYRLPVVAPSALAVAQDGSEATALPEKKLPVADFTQARLVLEAMLPLATSASVRAGAREATWLGALVPKRWAKRAVTRNLVRRQIAAVLCETLYRPDNRFFIPSEDPAGAQHLMFAYLVRMRASFHAPASGGSRGKKGKGQPERDHSRTENLSATPILRSAASELLKAQVRQELLLLLARAEATLAGEGDPREGRRPRPPAAGTAEVSV